MASAMAGFSASGTQSGRASEVQPLETACWISFTMSGPMFS
nr:hypothetical protein [Nocardioides bruguierae]